MPNKDTVRHQTSDPKTNSPQHGAPIKQVNVTSKANMTKVVGKDLTMSPGAPSAEDDRPELLGSLTTLQQQRTSARVIKKLKLEPPVDKRDSVECETPNKIEDKDPLNTAVFPTVKQRMPKALWSADEKSLFFEALNEYGKDFDAITAYICAKMKKKSLPDGSLKTKTQVSHFYYRTWHKLSKHVHFDENVKKVAQELYALINYGELRRKLVSVNERTCARLGELVRAGVMAVRARGRTLRVRTPMCRALRRLNQITERWSGARVCSRAQVSLRARDAAAWARVQAAAHNPRAAVALPLRTPLSTLLAALRRRWGRSSFKKRVTLDSGLDVKREADEPGKEDEEAEGREGREDEERDNHLGLEPDRCLVQENRLPRKLALHVGPRPDAQIHLPVLSASEQLSTQKICFSSYLERMSAKRDKDGCGVKIRTPKRQRKDSVTDKEKELETKKVKLDDTEPKFMNIDETAIDGIELMASYKSTLEDEEKPSTEDEKETKAEETAEEEVEREPERDKDMSEREKDSFSELEDDEKYNKSDTDNESDSKDKDKGAKEQKFKNLKVKFRIRPKKRGGSVYTLVLGKEDEGKEEPREDLKLKEGEEHKLKEGEEAKPDFDVDTALRQIRNGWSVADAGDLTIGDLYLMFGSRSKLELDYWWAEPTPPLPQPKAPERDRVSERREKASRTPDKDSGVEDDRDKRESDTDIFSPKNTFSQDSNDGMSGDERKCEPLSSPDHKSSGALRLVSKLINRPSAAPPPAGFALLSDRLRRLLALAGNVHVGAAGAPGRCGCGHVCAPSRKNAPLAAHAHKKQPPGKSEPAAVFRHPTPIAPRPDTESARPVSLEGLPRWRRGRPRAPERPPPAERRVVVQRLLPLLPDQPPHTNLIPVKLVSNSPRPLPRILPKPTPTTTANLSCFYVLGDALGNAPGVGGEQEEVREEEEEEQSADEVQDIKMDISTTEVAYRSNGKQESIPEPAALNPKTEQTDIANFLPAESLSLSPSRLLHEVEDGWLAGAAHDFSLSSFLHTLDARAPDHAVDSQLQSLMAESSVDYVAKFADLAAEVTDEQDPPAENLSLTDP